MNIDLSKYNQVEIQNIEFINTEDTVMYDLTIEEDHSFLIDIESDKILLHNCDGSHISGLLLNIINTFWPELFDFDMINLFRTPLVKVTIGKKVIDFFDEKEFEEWKANNPDIKFKSKYYKGLGTSKTDDFKSYLKNLDKHLIPLEAQDESDREIIDLLFDGSKADERKKWLKLTEDEQ